MPRAGSKGHLWLRGESYYAIWYRNGSRFCVNTHTASEAEAQTEMARLIADCEAGNAPRVDRTPPSIGVLLNEVLRYYRRKGRKSLEHVERHVKRLKAGFAGKRADEITTDRVNQYAESRQDEGAANATINRELAVLRLGFSLARKSARVKPDVIPYFEMLPEDNRRTGFFEQEQYEAVLRQLPEYLRGALTIAYWTGMRKEEVLGLTWERVDLFNRLVFLEKTKNGEDRTLPLNDELFAALREQSKSRADGCPYVLLVPNFFSAREDFALRRPWTTG